MSKALLMGKLSFVQTAARKGMHDVGKIHGSNFSTMRRKYPGVVRILFRGKGGRQIKVETFEPKRVEG